MHGVSGLNKTILFIIQTKKIYLQSYMYLNILILFPDWRISVAFHRGRKLINGLSPAIYICPSIRSR